MDTLRTSQKMLALAKSYTEVTQKEYREYNKKADEEIKFINARLATGYYEGTPSLEILRESKFNNLVGKRIVEDKAIKTFKEKR